MLDKDRSILAQVAVKAAAPIVQGLIRTQNLSEADAIATAVRVSEELKAYLYELHGYGNVVPAAHVTSDSVELVQDAFPGTTEVTDSLYDEGQPKQPRRVTPPTMAQSNGQQGYQFKNQKAPIPAYFWADKKVTDNPHIKFWYDERGDDGEPQVAASGNNRPAFKSVLAKGADRSTQLSVFAPKGN